MNGGKTMFLCSWRQLLICFSWMHMPESSIYAGRSRRERKRSLSLRECMGETLLKQDLFLHTTQCHFHKLIFGLGGRWWIGTIVIHFLQLFSKYFKSESSNEAKFPLSHLICPHVHQSTWKYLSLLHCKMALLYLHAEIPYMPLSF